MEHTRTKILYVITKSTLGGAQRYVYDLATELPPDQFDVRVVVGGEGPLYDQLREAGLKVQTLPSLKRNISLISDIQTFFSLVSIIRKEKPNVLHLNSSKVGLLGALAGRLMFVPRIVFTAHGWSFNEDRPEWQRFILKALHWLTILLSHQTIAVSNGMMRQMDWPFVQSKMHVVHLGRTVQGIRTKDDARGIIEMRIRNTEARLIDYHDDLWLGTVAELHPTKRLDRAITAVSVLVKEFPGLRFIIVHDGQERERLMQQVRDLGLENHVFFTGIIEDAARIISAFDIFVLPSVSEAFGYVLIEAGLAGVPVVATNVGGIPDIIENGKNGLLVNPDDTPALTSALRTLLVDTQKRRMLAEAHTLKAQTFTFEKMLAETLEIYRG